MSISAFGVDHGGISKAEKELSTPRSVLLGGTLAGVKDAPKGKKMAAYKAAQKERLPKVAAGAAGGAGLGLAASAASRGRFRPGISAGFGALGGSTAVDLAHNQKTYRAARKAS